MAILETNKKKHTAAVVEAMAEYKTKMLEWLDKVRAKVENGEMVHPFGIGVGLVPGERIVGPPPIPSDYTKEYERALGMLAHEVRNEVTLSAQAYAQFVDDEWEWSDQFRGTTLAYAGANAVYNGA
jgi:hypothetical protein